MKKESIIDGETVLCFVGGMTAILGISLLVLL
jgi:hypothetical protein